MFHECFIIGCPAVTIHDCWANPRERWMLDILLKDDDGSTIHLNLCPKHVLELFNLHERDYVELEKTERIVSGVDEMRPV